MSLDVMLSCECCGHDFYSSNITHNLNTMASEAGIYKHLWRPDEIGIDRAEQLIQPLTDGLALQMTITHPHFGPDPVEVYAIKVARHD